MDTSVYRLVQKNIVVFRAIDIFDQNGQQSSNGFEVEVRGRAGQRLTVFGNYGFSDAQFDDFISDGVDLRGNVPAFAPRHTARLWGTYEFPRGIGVSLGSRYVGQRAIDAFNQLFLGGYTIWDAGLYYRLSKMEYSVNVHNLFNKTNYFVSSIVFNSVQLYPGQPAKVIATARYRF